MFLIRVILLKLFILWHPHLADTAVPTSLYQIHENLVVNTTCCSWRTGTANHWHEVHGKLTQHQFSNKTFNNGPHNYSVCLFNISSPINITHSAVVNLTGRNSLFINATENVVISSNVFVTKTSPSPPSDMWLGGYCSFSLNQTKIEGSGPGGGHSPSLGPGPGGGHCDAGSAGHGGKADKFRKDGNGIKYGWSYGNNIIHMHKHLIGGSSGGIKQSESAITCGGGAIKIFSRKTINVDATISTNAYTFSSNDSCIGGSSGGTIILISQKLILKSNASLLSRGTPGSSPINPGSSGSGGIIFLNSTIYGNEVNIPDPRVNTGLENVFGENGMVVINGRNIQRLPAGRNNKRDYIGCFSRNITFSHSDLPDYKVRPTTCKDKCRVKKCSYALLHEKTCVCLHENTYTTLEPVNDSLCDLRCFGRYTHFCGGEQTNTLLYTVYWSGIGNNTTICSCNTSLVFSIQPNSPTKSSTHCSDTITTTKTTTHSDAITSTKTTTHSDAIIPTRTTAHSDAITTTKTHSDTNSPPTTTTKSTTPFVATTNATTTTVSNVSKQIQELATMPITKKNSTETLEKLHNLVTAVVCLSPGDLKSSLSIFNTIIHRKLVSTKHINESKHIGQIVLNIADKLLSEYCVQSWNNLEKNVDNDPETVLRYVEDIIKFLGTGMKVNETLNRNSKKFGIYIEVFNPLNFHGRNYTFSGLDIQENSVNFTSSEIQKFENIFIPSTLVNSIEGTESLSLNLLKYQPSLSLMKATLAENRTSNTSLVSNIIAVSLSRSLSKELKNNVILSFPATKENASRESCRFLGFSNSSKTVWSKEGCETSVDFLGNIKCSCNHFTHFAVLLKLDNTQIDSVHEHALHWITYLGCGISLICLILTLITFVFLKNLTSEHTMIHCNLAASLALAQIVFLLGTKATEAKIACKTTAILLHYFYTVSFCWMCVEGIHLYRKVVKVFIRVNDKKLYYVFGWGVPALLVFICALTNYEGYGNKKACWLSVESGLIWAFVIPVLIILLINLIILIMVVRAMFVVVNSLPSSGKTSSIRTGVKGILFLLPLLGLTWLFGVLAVNSVTVVFQYIFTILNSLQGFFIFMFHCVFNSEVRAAFKRQQLKTSLQRSLNDSPSRNKVKKVDEKNKTVHTSIKATNRRISPGITVCQI